MTLLRSLLLASLLSVSIVHAQCEQGNSLIPCGPGTSSVPETAITGREGLELTYPLFNKDNVALDSPPEQIDMLNSPTWANAHRAALSRIYRNYRAFLAAQMITAVQERLLADVKKRHGLDDTDMIKILEIIVKEHGLPTVDLEAAGLAPDPILERARKALSAVSAGGSP